MITLRRLILLAVLPISACSSTLFEPAHSQRYDALALQPPVELLETTRVRVVRVVHDEVPPPRALGTGVIVGHDGHAYILTASHVLSSSIPEESGFVLARPNKRGMAIEFSDGGRVAVDHFLLIARTDVAVIGPFRMPERLMQTRFLDVGSMSDASPGDPLLIWGSPLGYGPAPFLGTLAYRHLYLVDAAAGRGVISSLVSNNLGMDQAVEIARKQESLLGFQSAAGVAKGVSGGPAFDETGRLFGLVGFGIRHASDPASSRAMGVVGKAVKSEILAAMKLLSTLPPSH